MSKNYIPITQARKDLFQIAQNAQKPDAHYILTIDGKPELALMSFEEYEALLETIDFLSEPNALQNLKTAEKEIEDGKVYDWSYVKKELGQSRIFSKEPAMFVADAPDQKYQPRQRKTKKKN